MIIWPHLIILTIGFSLLVSVKVKRLTILGFSVSLVISSLLHIVSCAVSSVGLFLSGIETICFYFAITLCLIFLIYIFFRREIDDYLDIDFIKLSINLVPRSRWGKNCREIEPYKSKWLEISYFMLSRTTKCRICGISKTKDLKFECHEEWSYNNNTQKLLKVMVLCQKCHRVKHIGRTKILGNIPFSEAKKHMQLVNGCSINRVLEYISSAFEEIKELNKIKTWKWDAEWLDYFIRENKKSLLSKKRFYN